ncbi:MAG: ligand-binding sensor domain-containing protein, partial [Planctomycetota bacterium]
MNRYDGYSFKSYYHDESDTSSLSSDYIVSMCEDHEGMIWIGNMFGGLNSYNPVTDKFTRYPKGQNDPFHLRQATIWTICRTQSGAIWFSAIDNNHQSIYQIDPLTERIQYVTHDTNSPEFRADIHSHAIIQDSEGNIWVGGLGCLLKYDSIGGKFTAFKYDSFNRDSLSCEVASIYEDRTGMLWIGTWMSGIQLFNRKTNCFLSSFPEPAYTVSLGRNDIYAMTEDNKGNIIYRNGNSLNFLDKETGQITTLMERTSSMGGINVATALRSFYWDTAGVLWYGVIEGNNIPEGVYKLSMLKKNFRHIQSGQLQIKNPSVGWIGSICQDTEGDIWLGGTLVGLIKVNLTHSPPSFHHYPADPDDPFSLSSENISAIYQDNAGTVWIGCWEDGTLHKLDVSNITENIVRYKPEIKIESGQPYNPTVDFQYSDLSTGKPGTGSMRIFEDSKSNFWIARGTGLELFDRSTGNFHAYELDPGKHENHDLPLISGISEGLSGCLWIGTMHQGLFKIIPPVRIDQSGRATGKKTISYRYDRAMPTDLGDLMITSLCVPKANKDTELWIGTWGGGLFGLTRSKTSSGEEIKQFVNYTVNDGLPDNIVLGILEDKHGDLWLSTEYGLCRFNPQTGKLNTYLETDGMPIQRFHWLSSHEGKNGQMFFGGKNGLLSF